MSEQKSQEVYRVAHELFQQDPDWVIFFREVLGLGGVVRKAYPSAEDMAEFEQTDQYNEIQGMLSRLRERGRSQPQQQEPTAVITVRLPKSLHDALRAEAHERQTSMNKLCIAKLVQNLEAGEMADEGTSGGSGNDEMPSEVRFARQQAGTPYSSSDNL